ncbi:MAG: hypothetical protein ABWY05_02530 [Noviherbaspirillum sp.]
MTPSAARASHFLFLSVLLCLTIAVLQGCGGGDDPRPAGTAIRATAPAARCPGPKLADRSTVIHVAATGADSESCGDRPETACATISRGIARCPVSGCAVAVRHGLYPTSATIRLRDAVSVHGSCRFGAELECHYRTVIAAAPPAGEPAIDAAGISSATELSGIVVLGKDETAPGEASIAMRISASRGLVLAALMLSSGRGGDGAPGAAARAAPAGPRTALFSRKDAARTATASQRHQRWRRFNSPGRPAAGPGAATAAPSAAIAPGMRPSRRAMPATASRVNSATAPAWPQTRARMRPRPAVSPAAAGWPPAAGKGRPAVPEAAAAAVAAVRAAKAGSRVAPR